MKAVILAGGLGTRLAEETNVKPKPMVDIGTKPILWHIMKIYSNHGINDFVVCLGYKGYVIKEYFANYFLHSSDVTFDLANNSLEVHHKSDSFDHSGIEADRNMGLPLDRAHELAAAGVMGDAAPRHISLMGSITAPGRLVRQTLPEISKLLLADQVDIALLVPM